MRNPNGTGTITKKSGRNKPWIVYGAGVLVDGTYKRPYLGAFRTKKEAEERRMAYYSNPEIKKVDLTFKNVYDDFCGSARFKKLSKSQQQCYQAAFKRAERLCPLTFANIRTAQMQEEIDRLAESGASFSSVSKLKVLFSVLYSYALENDIVAKNYATYIIVPDIDQKQKRSLTDMELAAIKKAACSGDMAAQWTIYLICSGWRISEMLELTRFNYNEKEKAFCGGKKTKSGKNRLVPVHSAVQPYVDAQLAYGGETVFCMQSGKPMTANYFRKFVFAPMLDRLKLDPTLTPHSTRHTFATLLKRGGADEFYRKRLLGHSAGNVTDDIYTHEDLDSLRKAIEKIILPQVKKAGENSAATA